MLNKSVTLQNFTIKDLLRQAIIASLYVVLVLIFHFVSFDAIQFRVAELLLILVFFDQKSVVGLTIGVVISNLFSPIMLYDIAFGTLATTITLLLMLLLRKWPYIALLIPSIINGPVIGLMLYIATGAPFLLTTLQVFIGEFVVTYIFGLPIYYLLKRLNFENIYFGE